MVLVILRHFPPVPPPQIDSPLPLISVSSRFGLLCACCKAPHELMADQW